MYISNTIFLPPQKKKKIQFFEVYVKKMVGEKIDILNVLINAFKMYFPILT